MYRLQNTIGFPSKMIATTTKTKTTITGVLIMAQCRQRLECVRHLVPGTSKVWWTNHSVFDTHAAEHQSKNRHLPPKVCFHCHFSLVDHFSLPTRFLHSSHYCHHGDSPLFSTLIPERFIIIYQLISRLTHIADFSSLALLSIDSLNF